MSKHNDLTVEDANQRLPLVRCIVRDVLQLKADVLARQERLNELRRHHPGLSDDSNYADEVLQMEEAVEDDEIRLDGFAAELASIGATLVDAQTGLVEFNSSFGPEAVFLSWMYDEPEVTHWRTEREVPGARRPLVLTEQEAG